MASPTSYTVSGPTTGRACANSALFTVALNGDAAADDAITLSDNSAGGTFTVNGALYAGSVTVIFGGGETGFTFTYMPASAGAKTLTFTNISGWANPADATYTASLPRDDNFDARFLRQIRRRLKKNG
jgi:hypothetical protein